MSLTKQLMIVVLGMETLAAMAAASPALASGWDCSANCLGMNYWYGTVLLGQPQVTAGSQSATQADTYRMLQDSCAREGGAYVEPVVPAKACQQDASIPDNDPPTVSVGFVPPGGIGG